MASYAAYYTVASDTYTLAYVPMSDSPGMQPGGTFSDGEPVPDGVWTAFASPFMVDPFGGIGFVLVTETGQVFEFLAHQHPPVAEGVVFVPFAGHGSYLHLRIEHLEDGTLVFAHSTNLRDWTEASRFIPDAPVKEIGLALRHDRDEQPATGQIAEVRLLTGLWTNAVEYVDLGAPDEPLPIVEQRTVVGVQAVEPGVTSTSEPLVHAIVGGQFGDLEFDVGKSVRWLDWYTDNLFVLDVNLGTPRYWIVNWAETFPDAKHTITSINYFVLPTEFRKEQWKQYKLAFGTPEDDDWIFFVDAHEGLSFDNRSLPDDYDFAPFRSFLWREIQRAQDNGESSAALPFYVFLRSDHYTNVTYASDIVDSEGRAAVVEQTLSVPYYQAYRGVRRLWKASELKKPSFDWARIDALEDPDLTAKAQIISYGYAHWNLQDIEPGYTGVATINAENDDGWRMRNLLSMVRPVPGLPVGDIWIHPEEDPVGLPGPWTPDDFMHSTPLDPKTFQPMDAPVPSDPSLAGLVTPLYDCVFRINLRDGVWYEEGNSGNIPLRWDEDLPGWVTDYNPDYWQDVGVRAFTGEVYASRPGPFGSGPYGSGPYGGLDLQ